MFGPISDNIALSQKIVAQVTDAIVRGELKPGDRLPPERELAVQFQVSRTAIRDAIKILSGRGLLTVKHGVGIFVAEPRPSSLDEGGVLDISNGSIRDLFEIRKTLETQAAFWAAARATDAHLQRLSNIMEEAKTHTDDLAVLSACDAQFHVAVAEASQNMVLVKVMWALLDLLAEARRESLRIPNRAVASLHEHEQIVEAIVSRDAERARRVMLRHLDSVEYAIQNSLATKSSS